MLSTSFSDLLVINEDENRIVLQFSEDGYVRIDSNVYQVDENNRVEVNLKVLYLKAQRYT